MRSTSSNRIDDTGKAQWNNSYESKARAAGNLWGEAPVPWVSMSIERFRHDDARVVIDLPCGDGRNALYLARDLPFLVGADSSANALSIANRRAASLGLRNVILQQEDVFGTSFADNQFDGVFCCDVLGHLVNASDALREVVRICRPGKLVIGNCFALEDTTRGREMERISGEEYYYRRKFYFCFRDKEQVRQLLGDVPVDIVSIELIRWDEPAHEGYREYPHEHASWVFVARKQGGMF